MSTNYSMNPDLEQFKQKLKEVAKNDLQTLQQDIVNTKEDCTIFINISNNSQGVIRFLSDTTKEYVNQVVKLYFVTTAGIEQFIGPLYLTHEKLNKIYNIISHYDNDYSIHDICIVHKFINDNNIINSFIYF